jgi:hypothetical protein
MIFSRIILLFAVLGQFAQTASSTEEDPVKANLRGSGGAITGAQEAEQHYEDARALAFKETNNSTAASPHNIVGGAISAARPWFVEGNGYVLLPFMLYQIFDYEGFSKSLGRTLTVFWLRPDLCSDRFSSCGGTLIWRDFVLTAAHCWDSNNAYNAWAANSTVFIGNTRTRTQTPGADRKKVSRVFRFSTYNPNTSENDYMLVQLNTPVDSTRPLATYNGKSAVPAAGQILTTMVRFRTSGECVFAEKIAPESRVWVRSSHAISWCQFSLLSLQGFGTTSSGGSASTNFLSVNVPVVATTTCASNYGPGQIFANSMFCAGSTGKDSCQVN